ncbi:MAG: SPOR domain-containing protein [Syntrophales bacterium]|jgi:cell division septation protein DedD|nr:SPOR domain-containing protein [Syntrophales bacterium]
MVAKNRRTLELKLGKLGLILFVSGMSVLLFSTFLLGMLVGKHLDAYPERYSGGLVDLVRGRFSGLAMAPQKQETPLPDGQRVEGGPATGEEDFDLTFYRTLGDKKGSKGIVENDSLSDEKTTASAAKNHSLSGEAAAGDVARKVAPVNPGPVSPLAGREADKTVLPGQKKFSEAPAAPPLPGAADAEKTQKKDSFHVQVAAYRDVTQAKKMEKRLKLLGFATMIVPKDIPDKGKWFRVIAVGFEDRQKAESAVARITQKIMGVQCIIRRNKGGEA